MLNWGPEQVFCKGSAVYKEYKIVRELDLLRISTSSPAS